MSSPFTQRLAEVRARIARAAAAAGRDPASVQLVGVSKLHPVSACAEAVAAGLGDLGENYASELRDKAAALASAEVRWHFIGRVQKAGVRHIAPVAFRVHALETVAQAEALVARAPAGLDALLAVNTGGEDSKSGVAPHEVMPRLRALSGVAGLRLRGLMTLPPFHEDPEEVAPYFAELADLAARARADGHPLTELSMGMSHDLEVAVRHGATWVRVGTALFGERPVT